MANYPIPDEPGYNPEIEAIRNDQKVKADTVLNPVLGQMIENTHYLRRRTPYEGVTAGTGTAYTVAIDDFELFDGAELKLKLHAANTANCTLAVNGGAAMPIYNAAGNPLRTLDIGANAYVKLVYDGAFGRFFMLGGSSPILTGNATAGDVLSGKTFYGTDPKTKLTGTLNLGGYTKYETGTIRTTGTGSGPYYTHNVTGRPFTPKRVVVENAVGSTTFILFLTDDATPYQYAVGPGNTANGNFYSGRIQAGGFQYVVGFTEWDIKYEMWG